MSMRKKYSGSVVRANPVVPTEDSAPGIWTLEQQNQNQKKGTWPFIGDPNFKDTILLLHGDTSQQPSIEDKSASNHQVTVAGDAKATNWNPFNLPEGYWSRSIDSSSDTSDYHSTITLGTDDFTIGMWVFPTGYDGTIQSLADHVTLYSSANDELILAHSQFLSHYNGSGWNIEINYTTDLVINTWQWIQVDKTGNLYRVSIDGSYVDGGGKSSSDSFGAFGNTYFGHRAGQKDYLGYMSNFVFIIGTNRGTIAPPTAPIVTNANTDIITYQSNRFVNKGNASLTFTVNASTKNKTSTFSPFSYTPTTTVNNYGSYYFDGTGDYLQLTNTNFTDFDFGTGPFLIEGWIYYTTLGTTIIGQTGWGTVFQRNSTSNVFQFYQADASGNNGSYWITGTTTIQAYQWYHFALQRDNSGTLDLWINGSRDATSTSFAATDMKFHSTKGDVTVAYWNSGVSPGVNYISNLRIAKSAIYTSGASIIVPTKPVELTLTEGENSVEFDGTGDYLNVTYSSSLNFGTGDFTIEFWAYQETATDYTTWYSHGYISQSGNILLQSDNNSSNIRVYLNTNSPQITSSSSLTLNAWTHVALVRSSGQVTLYFNGVSVGTSSTSSINLNETSDVTIGMGDSSHYLDGYISNMRLTAKALYTGTFTPPDAPFSGTTGVLLACASRYIEDRSPANNYITTYADAVVSGFNPFNEGYWSNYFDGSGDYFQVNSFSHTLSGQWSWECWVYKLDTGIDVICSDNSLDDFQVALTSPNINFQYGGSQRFDVSTGFNQNVWYHICITRDGSNNIRCFINGVLKAYVTSMSSNPVLGVLNIGRQDNGGSTSHPTYAYLSNLRFVIGSIPTDYQTSETSTGTSVFTSPTDVLTTSSQGTTASDVKLLTCQSSRFLDNSASSHSITVSGNTSISNDIPFTLLSRQTKLLNLQNNQDVNNNSFQDSSIIRNLVTKTGNVTQGTFSPFGAEEGYWSVFIDGTDDILSVPNSSNHEFGTGQFTVELWVYMSNKDGTNGQGFLGNYGSASNGWAVQLYGDNLEFAVKNGQIAQYDWSSRENNRWYHLAFARDGSNNMRAFIDGTQVVTGVKTDDITIGSNALQIGNMGPSITRRFKGGYISNVRIVKGTALYTSTFTRPTAPLTTTSQGATASEVELLMCQSSSFVDNSSNGFTITLTSTPTISWFPYVPLTPRRSYSKDVVGGSAYFDGSGDYLTTDTGDTFDFTREFTVECWFYLTDDVNWGVLFCANVSDRFQIAVTNSDTIDLRFNGGILGTPFSINKNEWNHIAVTRDSSNVVRQFLNGVLKNTDTNTNSLDNGYMRIGANQNGANPFEGYIANARIVNGQAIYTTAFDTPTSLVTRTSDTKLLMNFTDGAVIDNTGKNNLETIADAKVSSYVRKFGNGSMYFDGTGDYLVVSNSNSSTSFFSPATDDFTWEMFVRFSVLSAGNLYTLFSKYGSAAEYQFFYNAGNHWNLSHGATTVQWADTSIVVNTWYHIALVKDGTDFEVFRNGTSLGTVTHSNPSAGARPFVLGATFDGSNNATYNLNGYLDDVRITKGVARYTSNFTAPTRAFKNR